MNRWREYNANPLSKRVGDCTIRALSKALDKDWETVYAELSAIGFELCDMPSANFVWGAYLRRNGFKRNIVDDHGQDIYTVDDFCRDNPHGVYVLAIPGHVVCVVDGFYWDSWDSGGEVPQYFWAKERE